MLFRSLKYFHSKYEIARVLFFAIKKDHDLKRKSADLFFFMTVTPTRRLKSEANKMLDGGFVGSFQGLVPHEKKRQ